MVFSEETLAAGCGIAARIYEAHKDRSAFDLKRMLLSAYSGIPTNSASLDCLVPVFASKVRELSVLAVVAALCELDRIAGEREIPPVRVMDIMSHMQAYRENLPPDAAIVCHGDAMLPLALWFASQHVASVTYSGNREFVRLCSGLFPVRIVHADEEGIFVKQAWHFASVVRNSVAFLAFHRKLRRSCYKGAVVLTTWSFLNCGNPRILSFKQQIVENGELRCALQLPSGIMSRVLPALLQLAPGESGKGFSVRIIDARDWFFIGCDKTVEVSFLAPILNQLDRKRQESSFPVPPAGDVLPSELILRQCDLRLGNNQKTDMDKFERLGDCSIMVRGQMFPRKGPGESVHSYSEVMLTDIDEFGCIMSASHVMEGVPSLPRSREVALLRKNDILISFKGTIGSIGRVGLVTDIQPNCLPSQTFYLVRPEEIDSLWLFYFLRSPEAQVYFREHISGTTVPQIKIADLSALQIPIPNEEKLRKIHQFHDEFTKNNKKIQKIREGQIALLKQCDGIFS